jgi:hypothetical protein
VVLVGQGTPVGGLGRYRFAARGHLLGRGIEPCAFYFKLPVLRLSLLPMSADVGIMLFMSAVTVV